MKHILFLEQYGNMGGGQQVLIELVRAALTMGHRITVFIPRGQCADKLRQIGVRVKEVPICKISQGKKTIKDYFHFVWYGWQIFRNCIDLLNSADIIYVNGNRLLFTAILSQLFLGRKTVFHIHLNYGGLARKLFLYILHLKKTVAVVCPSTFIRQQFFTSEKYYNDPRVYVVANGLDARFSNVAFEDRFSNRPLRHIGIVGRVSLEKGQDVFLALASYFPNLQFHILGDGAFSEKDYYENLQHQAKKNIYFHGWIDNLPEKIQEIGLQVCLVPSRNSLAAPTQSFEAAPLVPLQMLSLSCLVVVRKLGVLEELAKEFQLPMFTDDAELIPLLKALCEQDPHTLAQKVQNTYHHCMEKYAYAPFQQRLQDFLASITS